MRRVLLAIATITLGLPFSAQAELRAVASFSILGDMVGIVAGEHATVDTIVGPDADAHVYQPSASDAKSVARADIIFVNGLGFETWSDSLIKTSGSKAPVIVATSGVTPLMVEGKIDPHAWNSLKNGVIYVSNIAEAFAEHDPDNAPAYRSNAAAYIAELKALDTRAGEAFAALGETSLTVVTAHDAFGYLADAYGMTFLAPLGVSGEAEPSARDLAALITQLKDKEVAALFVENVTSPALVNQISRETGLDVGGRLFSDALSARGGPATSYLAMYEYNLTTLVEALSK